jgi:hypothetical protein
VEVTPPPPPPPPASTGEHVEKRFNYGLIGAGAGVLGGGYLIALIVEIGANIYTASEPANQCWGVVTQTAWIPFVGPLLAMVDQSGRTDQGHNSCTASTGTNSYLYASGLAVAGLDTLLQVGGAALLTLGFVFRKDEIVHDDVHTSMLGGTPQWAVRLGAPGAPLGLTFTLTRF